MWYSAIGSYSKWGHGFPGLQGVSDSVKFAQLFVHPAGDGLFDPRYGALVFSHRCLTGAPEEYFTKDDVLSVQVNALDQPSHKYSRLGDLEQFRAADGAFHFTLVYPDQQTADKVTQWKQTR